MKFDKKWIRVMGLALGFPSLILGSAIFFMNLVEQAFIPKWLGVTLFFLVVGNMLFLMVALGFKNKK